nr:hypothetical protein [Anaerolineae bacterium]
MLAFLWRLFSGRKRALAAIALGCALFLIYLFVFSGFPVTDDERFIIDTTESVAIHHNVLLNQTAYIGLVQKTNVEPAQPLLSVPLFWMAYQVPWVGNVHALYLFSPLVTALTAVILFYYALDLGYEGRTALAAGVVFGTSTIVWPYTRTYFREPLTMFSLFLALFLMQRWRQSFVAGRKRHWLYFMLGVGTLLIAILSKEAAIIAIPLLLLTAYPGSYRPSITRKRATGVVIAFAAALVVFALVLVTMRQQLDILDTRYNFGARISMLLTGLPDAGRGLLGYLFSPGRGIWWYSPILLLSLASPFLLPRKRWRESWLILGFLLLVATSYAAVRGEQWFGGTGWGARYLVPLVPFLMVAVLPALDRAMKGQPGWLIPVVLLFLLGVSVQCIGVAVNVPGLDAYIASGSGIAPWLPDVVWSLQWSQIPAGWRYLAVNNPDILWFLNRNYTAAGAIGLALCIIITLGIAVGRTRWKRLWLAPATYLAIPILTAGATLFALAQGYDDARFLGDREDLAQMRQYLYENAAPTDPIVLSSLTYVPHFSNYYKGQSTWYGLPYAPGERYHPDIPPQVENGSPVELVGERTEYLLHLFRYGGAFNPRYRIWLVGDQSPWLPWAVLPVERYLTEYNYLLGEQEFSSQARVTSYLPMYAPRIGDPPVFPVNARFGEGMLLSGIDLEVRVEDGEAGPLHPGDMLGVSLLWVVEGSIDLDYTIAIHFIDANGLSVLQSDRQPVGGFAPTSTWKVGDIYRDNYGFILPESLAPGRYEIWVSAYSYPDLSLMPVTAHDGTVLGEHVVAGEIFVE